MAQSGCKVSGNMYGLCSDFVGSYHDHVDCDVVPMDACSLLLGRPWIYDIDALHHGRTNQFSFMFKGKKILF